MRPRRWLGARALAVLAPGDDLDVDVVDDAEGGLGQRHLEVDDGVGPLLRAPPAGPAAPELVAEERAEDVAEAAEGRGALVAVAVVARPPVLVGQHLVGLVDGPELLPGRAVGAGDVRMEPAGEPAVGPLDLLRRRPSGDTEHVVVVALGGHRSTANGTRPARAGAPFRHAPRGHHRSMKVVVVGATGNVGTAVLRALATDPRVDEVVGVARRLPEGGRYAGARILAADIARDPLDPAFAGADALIHLAWALQPSRDLAALRRTNVEGTRRVLEAASRNRLSAVVVASSVGVYSPGPKDRRVDESWPRRGVRSSEYARFKAQLEDLADDFERRHPAVRVVRLRPALIFQPTASSEQRRLFAGPLVPGSLARPGLLPALPRIDGLVTQVVHADDVADAYRLAVTGDARGAFNVATEPTVDLPLLQRVLEADGSFPVPRRLARGAYLAAYHLRLVPTRPGWLDLALGTPLLDTTRAREVLGWQPRHDAESTLRALLDGLVSDAGDSTPPLRHDAGGRARIGELLSRVGGTDDVRTGGRASG